MSAAFDTRDSDESIHRMDTVPPPDGEDDAYSAETKVGAMAEGMMEALMASARGEEVPAPAAPPVSTTRNVALPKPPRLPSMDRALAAAPSTTQSGLGEASERVDTTALAGADAPAAPLRLDAAWMASMPAPLASPLAPATRPRYTAVELTILAAALLVLLGSVAALLRAVL